MASGVWSFALAEIARGNIDYLNDTIKARCVNSTFTPSFSSAQYLSNIASGDRIGDPATLGSKTISDSAVLDAADPTFLNVSSGLTIAAIVFYKDTGVESTSTLIAYHDVGDLSTDGNSVTYTMHANGVVDLG